MGQRGRGGRGGGRRGGPRGGRGGGGGRGGRAPAGYVLAPGSDTGVVVLKAELEFHEKLADKACPVAVVQGAEDKDGIRLKLESWKDLNALLAWFAEGLAADETAELSFSPKLNKQQRALVHSGCEAVGQDVLDSVSRGMGDARYVTVLKKGRGGEGVRGVLNEQQEHKAYWLWRWAQQAGLEASRDEVAEMVRDNAIKPELQELWASKAVQQRALQQLCGAAAAGDLPAIRSIVSANPGVLAEGVFDLQTGVAPLHVATKTGQLHSMHLLLELGAGLEWQDGAGLTALQISRKFDQSDAEGVLLRAGAVDPDARNWPGEAPQPTATAPSVQQPAAAVADGVSSPRATAPAAAPAAVAAGAAAAGKPANGALVHPAPRSVAASEGGDSESAIDSAASVCGTDVSRNVGDVSSLAGDAASVADGSEAAASPRAALGPLGSTLEAVGEQPNEAEEGEGEGKGGAEEGREGASSDAGTAGGASVAAEGEGEEPALAANGSSGSAAGSVGSPSGAEAAAAARANAEQQGKLLGDFMASAGNRRPDVEADLESSRSVCGSEMTYQQSVDISLASQDLSSPTSKDAAAEALPAAAAAPAPQEAAAAQPPLPQPAPPVAAQEAAAKAAAAVAAATEAAAVAGPPPAVAAQTKKEVWALTGYPGVDAAISEWGEWAAEHKGAVLAGAGVATGLLLLLGGSGRRRVA